jgi:hypothetical protein
MTRLRHRAARARRASLLLAAATLLASAPPLHAQQGSSPASSPVPAPPSAKPAAKQTAKSGTRSGGKSATKARRASSARTATTAPGAPALPREKRDSIFVADRWPVKGPAPLPGSILPAKRVVAYYGNPLSKRMGVLGEYPVDDMLARLDREVARWNKADPSTPVQPALHLIAVVAQGDSGTSGKWRLRMADTLIERVASWAARKNALLFLDVQVGTGSLQEVLPSLAPFLSRPNVHLGIDPEFSMKGGHKPGTRIGTMSAADVNYASGFLADLVTKHKVPPKILVVHRFTRPMLTNTRGIRLDPRVQVVLNMDGWGPQTLKRDSYVAYVASEPVQYAGFKLFYHNDEKKKGSRLMTPEEVLTLYPRPVYIQYQ